MVWHDKIKYSMFRYFIYFILILRSLPDLTSAECWKYGRNKRDDMTSHNYHGKFLMIFIAEIIINWLCFSLCLSLSLCSCQCLCLCLHHTRLSVCFAKNNLIKYNNNSENFTISVSLCWNSGERIKKTFPGITTMLLVEAKLWLKRVEREPKICFKL